jgi:hypothetical protein
MRQDTLDNCQNLLYHRPAPSVFSIKVIYSVMGQSKSREGLSLFTLRTSNE